jgi:putative DNA primase/helicase
MTAAEIATALGDARREGRAWWCRCPLHGGRSLILRDGDSDRVLATCWAGCDRRDVLAELRARGLLDRRGEDYRPRTAAPPRRSDDGHNDARRTAGALAIWRESVAATETIAQYLAGRRITLDVIPATLRYHPRCPRPHCEPMQAMVALVEHAAYGMVGIHRTYLTPDFRRHDRAALGPIGGGAVRLGMPRVGEWFAVAEGIETTLAVTAACAMPAWAALSAGGIRALILPPEVTHVIVCADHDASGTGERAAHDAAARWLTEGRHVRIAMPPSPDTDMADFLVAREFRHVA